MHRTPRAVLQSPWTAFTHRQRREEAIAFGRGPGNSLSGWEYGAWWLTRTCLLGEDLGGKDELGDRVGSPQRALWLVAYAKRFRALEALCKEPWFGLLGETLRGRIYRLVAGDNLPLLSLRRTGPLRVLVTGPPGGFAQRLADWLSATLELGEARPHFDLQQNERGRAVYWSDNPDWHDPAWNLSLRLVQHLEVPTVRETFDAIGTGGDYWSLVNYLPQWIMAECFHDAEAPEELDAVTELMAQVESFVESPWTDYSFPGGFEELLNVLLTWIFSPDDRSPPPQQRAAQARWDLDKPRPNNKVLDGIINEVRSAVVLQAWEEVATVSHVSRRLGLNRQTATKWVEKYCRQPSAD